MEKLKVLFVTQEITPYLPESEMSVIGRYLPQGIQERGKEIRTFMPKFGTINERRNQLHEVIRLSGMNLIINDSDHPLIIKVASIQSARMQVYFIDNEDYFQRKFIFSDEDGKEFTDNDERTIFFARGVLETVKKLRWPPDLVHCHGWMASLIPMYIKTAYRDDPIFNHTKVVYSVYENDFKKPLKSSFRNKLLIDGVLDKDIALIRNPNYINLSKLALSKTDGAIIASENINPNIRDFINKRKMPVLEYQNEKDYVDAYARFYDEILSSDVIESV